MPSKTEYSVIGIWEEGDSVFYRVAADGVELACAIRISRTQRATHGDAVLLAWCSHHTDRLKEKMIVDADLNEEVIR